MKVLWFSNTPASGDQLLGDKAERGGWLKSLDKVLKDHVDLHVAFYYPKFFEYFEFNNVHYYPISFKNWKIDIVKKLLHFPTNENKIIDEYLKVIDLVKPDIIHIHGSESNYLKIQDKTNIPIVLSIQGNFNGYLRQYTSSLNLMDLSYSPSIYKKGIKKFLIQENLKKEYFKTTYKANIERNNLLNLQNVIGRTDWDNRISRVLSPNSIYYHNDEILRDGFYDNDWLPNQNEKLIIHTTGGSNVYKGILTICETIVELNKLEINFEWNLFGINNEDHLIDIIKRKMGNSFPTKNIKFRGSVNENELIDYLKKSDLFVQASHAENSPNSLCEAMILGLPCIATFAGGTGSLLKDGEDGILIQDNDPFAMAGAILELANNKDLAIKYGQSARIKALNRHNKDKIVKDLINIYRNIIGIASK
jgi:glycosyltransferase involved in cell wall biosynthesis